MGLGPGDSLVAFLDLVGRVQLLDGLAEVLVDGGQEISLRGGASLEVVRADVPELGQSRVAHEEPAVGRRILYGVAELPLSLAGATDHCRIKTPVVKVTKVFLSEFWPSDIRA